MDISQVAFAINYADFELLSRSNYLPCAALVLLVDLAVIHLIMTRIMTRKRLRTSDIALLNLALTDLCYEAITTPLFLQCDYPTTPWLKKCDALYYAYTILNLSTAFHILRESIGYFFRTYRLSYEKQVEIAFSICAWCSSFLLAYIMTSSHLNFLNENAMVSLGQFKALGYFLFLIVLGAIGVTMLVAMCIMKVQKNIEHVSKKTAPDKLKSTTTSARLQSPEKGELVFRGIFLAFCVACVGSLIIGDGNETTKSIEIMKFFEINRFAARILNQFRLLYGFTDGHFRLKVSRKTVEK